MTFLICLCIGALLSLVWLLRRNGLSLGIPVAYLYSLLLIHLPGAFAHIVGKDFLFDSDLTEIAMRFVALGTICFVAGVWLSRAWVSKIPLWRSTDRNPFWWFCLLGGWACIYGLSPLYHIPSVSAVVDKAGSIWMLGVLLALRSAFRRKDYQRIALWFSTLMVYPILMLLLGGFLSYGSAAIIIVCSVLSISTRSYGKVVLGITLFTFVSLSIFVNYFQNRDNIRAQVWGGAPLENRIDSVVDIFRNFRWFDQTDHLHLAELDQRLNQNYFVGLAARRLQLGQSEYLLGESVWDGALALVPRIFWPNKPVTAGSEDIVRRMTGLRLSTTTSFGVGNVMEFQINFGLFGVIGGFLILGWLIGTLDLKAAVAERRGDFGRAILFFLPGVALILPNGSIVDIAGGSGAALLAAYGWKWIWKRFYLRGTTRYDEPTQHLGRSLQPSP